MKKAILTFGLFSMLMVLTSFTTENEPGGQQVPASKKTLEMSIQDNSVIGQQIPASRGILQMDLEPGGNGQQVPASRPWL